MFRGSSFHTIDSKGRIIIPARFKESIAEDGGQGIMVSRMDKCLYAYTYDEWYKIEKKFMSLPEKSESMRRFRRIFIGGAFDCAFDKQGRILIPPSLRQYAKIEKEITLVGALDHFEIWSKEKWDNENQQFEEDMEKEEVRNEISQLGL